MTNEEPNITEDELKEISLKYTIAIEKLFENIKLIQDSAFYKEIKERFKALMPYKFILINDQNAVVINNNLYLLFDGTFINDNDIEVSLPRDEVLILDIGAIVIIKKFNQVLIGIIIKVLENETFEVLIFHPLLRNKESFIVQKPNIFNMKDIELL